MRILVYAQHLSGVGHYVRGHEIARALAEAHDVFLVEGGFDVPRRAAGARLAAIPLPALRAGPHGLEPVDPRRDLGGVLAERRLALSRAAARIAPDAVVVEHYPFSKWELEPEILSLLHAAREADPAALRVCSLRDVCRKTRHEVGLAEAYRERVLERLGAHFDALLLHADPAVTRIEEHFPAAARIPVPIEYTGYVSEDVDRAAGSAPPPAIGPYAVASTGAGGDGAGFVLTCVAAWRRLHEEGAVGARRLVVFQGLLFGEEERERLRRATEGGPFVLREFAPDFLSWLAGADLSISRAGYNTCTNVLETRRRALLVPDARMSDQRFRARRLADLGLATLLDPEDITVDRLASAMEAALLREPPRHPVDLGGARRTRVVLERLTRRGGARTTGT